MSYLLCGLILQVTVDSSSLLVCFRTSFENCSGFCKKARSSPMAPTTSTSNEFDTPTNSPTNIASTGSGGFAGDEFSNNLFSDLAPLLTLFGEQVTKQFLSMSLGWADNLLLAMGPLGIITVIVSAIRVGRVRILKALVGRHGSEPDLC